MHNLYTFIIVLLALTSLCAPKNFHKIEDLPLNKILSHNLSSSFFLSSKPKGKHVSYYGESCETNDNCAPFFGLTCVNLTCSCASPDFIARLNPEKLGETQRKTECVLRAGSRCGVSLLPFKHRSIEDLPSTRTLSTAYFWNKLRKNLPFLTDVTGGLSMDFFDSDSNCVDNAHCTGGFCRCSPEHFKDYRGLCLRKRTIFQSCDSDSQCRSSEGLHCSQGKCQCTNSMVFDRVKRKCFIPVGGDCDAYSSIVEAECVRNADCSNDRCVCLPGYKMSSDGSCGIAHGGLCDMQGNICSDIQLTCRSGRCLCRYPVHQVFNDTLGQCLSKPDGPCIPSALISPEFEDSSFNQNCVPFAECVKSSYADETNVMFDYICKCIPGYGEDSSGNCIPSFSSECIEDDDCDQAIGQLACVNGRCACPDEMLTWDALKRKCVGVIGSRCKYIQLERILNINVDVPTDCVENGVCVEHVARLDGRCECKKGFEFSKVDMKCISV